MAKRVTTEERERIVALLEAGKPCNEVAREVGRSPQTISNIARDVGHEFGCLQAKKATEARRRYGEAERLGIVNAGFDKGIELLPDIIKPSQFRDWTIAIGVLMDKRRQEDPGDADTAQLEIIFRQVDRMADDYETAMESEASVEHQPE